MANEQSDLPQLPPYEQRLQEALKKYQNDLAEYRAQENPDGLHPNPQLEPSVRSIADSFQVGRWALTHRIEHGKGRKQGHAHEQRLSPVEEKTLVRWICQLEAWGFPPRISQLQAMASELLRKKGDMKPLGKNWNEKFKSRYPEITSKFCAVRDRQRAAMQDLDILTHWFELYERIKRENNVRDEDTYNMDERGCAIGILGSMRVMCRKGDKKPVLTQDGDRSWVTAIETCSSAGDMLPPLIVFKGKAIQNCWEDAVVESGCGAMLTYSDNGWTNNEIGLIYLEKLFDAHTKLRAQGRKRLLLLDGHDSHISGEFIQYAIDHDIILLCLPPHTTHMLQPLDVGLFQPLATKYTHNLRNRTGAKLGYKINKPEFIIVYAKSRLEALNESNIASAWRKSGLLPYNPAIVLDPIRQSRPFTPPDRTLTISGVGDETIDLTYTPAQAEQVNSIVAQLRAALATPLIDRLDQLQRGACAAIARADVVALENYELMEAERRKVKQGGRKKGCQRGRVLDRTTLKARTDGKKAKERAAAKKQASKAAETAVAFIRYMLPPAQTPAKSPAKSPAKILRLQLPPAALQRFLPAVFNIPALPPPISPLKMSLTEPIKASREKVAAEAAETAETAEKEAAETAEIRPIPLRISKRSQRIIRPTSKVSY